MSAAGWIALAAVVVLALVVGIGWRRSVRRVRVLRAENLALLGSAVVLADTIATGDAARAAHALAAARVEVAAEARTDDETTAAAVAADVEALADDRDAQILAVAELAGVGTDEA